ncbi:hypothetical protein DICPUDRAFT_84000 [Dictyostelium purpureum]|uniref:Uncharacterized protein n=1 Tax=Dictyostelium purpureum TaxID=5786 RepID=F1A1A3_DICPU|nr:uncharacterized protein DICPUDRAFT_84000 [Dictyostelium purpureum]EGC30023.1 hypothetical protein DICPUDRAFT_84000 [Dictyostelium purpureum]|eukprot:XP_003293450.1 hypothetical protein DICPUDRAFT_84000 [Dictyostelium purpureum]
MSSNSNQISNNKKKKIESEVIESQKLDDYYDVTQNEVKLTSKANSFRFQTFSEKISNIDINIFNKVGDVVIELEDDNDSYFHQTILAWRELNLTQHFNNFTIHIRKYHNSLPEIIIHKEKIIDILLQHISIDNSTALKPLLSILAALSRDLRSEFYESFYKILKVLITVLKNTNNSETIEEVFTSICYMFKFLEKQIIPNFFQLYEVYSELFFQKRKYIRKFAAESIAFFLRKITFEEYDLTLDQLFTHLQENQFEEEYIDAFSILLFHSVKGVKGKFHSRTEHILPLYLKKLNPDYSICSSDCKNKVIVSLFQLIKYHGQNEGSNLLPIWVTLKNESNLILENLKLLNNNTISANKKSTNNKKSTTLAAKSSNITKEYINNLSNQIETYFIIIKDWIQGGSKVIDVGDIFFIMDRFFTNTIFLKVFIENDFCSTNILGVLAKAFAISMSAKAHYNQYRGNMLGYLDNLFAIQGIQNSHLLIFQFCTSIQKDHLLDPTISNRLIKYLDKNTDQMDVNEMLSFVIRVYAMDENEEPLYADAIPSINIPTLSNKLELLLSNFNTNFNFKQQDFNSSSLWALISCITCLTQNKTILSILEKTTSLLESRLNWAKTSSSNTKEVEPLIYLLSQSLISYSILLYKLSHSDLPSLSNRILNLLKSYPSNLNILKLSSIYFEKLYLSDTNSESSSSTKKPTKKSSPVLINIELFKELLKLFNNNLSSKHNSIRKETISTLKNIHLCSKGQSEQDEDIQKVLGYCYEIETTQYHVHEARTVSSKMEAIGSIYSNFKVPFLNELLYNYMMGCLYIRYTPLWNAVQKNIVAFCKKDSSNFYPTLYKTLQNSEQTLLDLNKDKMLDDEVEEEEELIEEEEEEEENKEKQTQDKQVKEFVEEESNFNHISFERLVIKDKLNLLFLYDEVLEKLNLENNKSIEITAKNILLSSTDPISYNSTLWKTMSMIGSLIESQSKDIITLFLDFVRNDYNKFSKVFKSPLPFDFKDLVQERSTPKPYSKSQAQQLLIYYLEFFSQFKKPTKIYQEKLMRDLFYRCIDIDDPKVQFQSLQCYLLWSNPSVTPYKKNLESLIQDKSMREEMTKFIIAKDSPNSSIDSSHRKEIIDIVVKILLSKLNRKVTRSSVGSQRLTIFAYFSGLTSQELEPIVRRILAPFQSFLSKNLKSTGPIDQSSLSLLPSFDAQAYFLNILQASIKQLGSLLTPFLDDIVKILLAISNNSLITNVVNSKDKRPKIVGSIRSLTFRRFSEIFQQYQSWDYKSYVKELFNVFSSILPTLNAYGLPVGLRRCLLVVSSNPSLVGYLNQDMKLLPTILSFITHKPHQDAFLSIIENILLNVDPDEAEPSINEIYMKVLTPHIDSIINSVKTILLRSSKKSSTSETLSLNPSKLSKRQLLILSELSKFAKSSQQASDLLELLIPFLRYNKLQDDDDLVYSILIIFKNMLSLIDNPEKHVPTLSTLFGVFKTRLTRSTLSEIFLVLGDKVPYLKEIAPYLERINAFTKKSVQLETYDYDKRLQGYHYINDNLLHRIGHKELLPLFINFVFYLKDKDYSIKSSATTGISRLIKIVSEKINENGESDDQETNEKINLFTTIFIQSMRSSYNDKEVRDEYLTLFNQLLVEFKGHKSFYPDILPLLCIGEDDKNFIINYTHIQKHRKRLSFLQLKNVAETHKFSIETINHFILPLSVQAILETTIKDHGSAILGEVVKSLGVLAKNLEWKGYYQLLRKLISTMDDHPSRFKFFVKSVCEVIDEFHFFIDEVEVRKELVTGQEIKDDQQQQQDGTTEDDQEEDDEDDEDDEDLNDEERELREIENEQNNLVTEYNEEDQDENGVLKVSKTQANTTIKMRKKRSIGTKIVKTKNISEEIFQAITSVLTPSLQKHLIEQKVITSSKMDTGSAAIAERQRNEGVVNLSIALAILKLYKLLPNATSKLLYPNIIGKLCIGLKSKEFEVRDTTRNTLVQVMDTLGFRFFPYILKDMKSILKSGYQKYVLGHTLHALLNTLSKKIEPGVLDSQVPSLMEIIIEDLFGEQATQRENKNTQDTYPEAKTVKSFDSLRILANIIHFSNTDSIIKPIEEIITISNSPKLLPNLEEMMKKISKGLRLNKSLDFKNLSIITYQFITKGLRDGEINNRKKTITLDNSIGVARKPTFEETFSIQADPSKKKNEPNVRQLETLSFIFTELGFSLLIQAIKIHNSTDIEQYKAMIDPFVSYISKCLEHKQSRVVYLSLKCLLRIFNFDLPSVKTSSKSLTVQVLKRLQLDSGNEKITNTCYEVATLLLRDTKSELINEDQLKGILTLTRQHLTSNEQNITRSLKMLHALIKRKVLLPEIYDLMDLCVSMMIRSFKPSISSLISTIFIDFLLFYPMGDNRLKQQVAFLLKNLTYEHEDGRLIVLKTLNQIIIRFPQEVLNQYAIVIFTPLVVRLNADPSTQCRLLVGENIELLAKGVSPQNQQKIYDVTMLWFEKSSNNLALAKTSAQVFGLISGSLSNFENNVSNIIKHSVQFIKQSLISLKEKEASLTIIDEISEETQNASQVLPGWQLTYTIFTSFEKILSNHPKVATLQEMNEFWNISIEFLNYPHIWVRTSLTRLYNIFFTQNSILNTIPIVNQITSLENNTIKKKSSTATKPTFSPVFNTLFNSKSIFEITKKHCSILNSRLLTDELGLTIIKNLIYLSILFYKCNIIKLNNNNDITPNIFLDIKEFDEQKEEEQDNVDDDDKMELEEQQQEEQEQEQEQEEMDQQVDEQDDDDLVDEKPQEQESSILLWLFKRLSYMSTKPGLLRRKYIFRWIAAVSTQLTTQELMPYLSILLIPLIKCTDEKIRCSPQERKLAQEVIDLLKKKIGSSKFMNIYQGIIQATTELRNKRREDKKIFQVTNPKEFLQQKLEKRQLTKDKKRRKKRESVKELLDDRKRIRVSQSNINNNDN